MTIARALASVGGDLVHRLGGSLGAAARAALAEPATRQERARWLAEARAPLPAGLRNVDASWIETELDELPPRARRALASGGGSATDVWLVRWACAHIPPLPAVRELHAPRSIEDVVAMARLAEWLEAVGLQQLHYAVSLAVPGAARRPELGPARVVLERCKLGDARRIAARAIAPYSDAWTARQTAVRLPRPLGLSIEAELLAHARDPIEHAPAWSALVLP